MMNRAALVLCLGLSAAAAVRLAVAAAHAGPQQCAVRTGNGTGFSESVAKFQVYEGILHATDLSVWAEWMASGSTPGYKVGRVAYKCETGSGLGMTCRGKSKICKL